MVIPALIYKIFEWIYYKFFATGPPDPNRKTFEEKFPCPMANSGLPNPHKEMTEKAQETNSTADANTSASEAESEKLKDE